MIDLFDRSLKISDISVIFTGLTERFHRLPLPRSAVSERTNGEKTSQRDSSLVRVALLAALCAGPSLREIPVALLESHGSNVDAPQTFMGDRALDVRGLPCLCAEKYWEAVHGGREGEQYRSCDAQIEQTNQFSRVHISARITIAYSLGVGSENGACFALKWFASPPTR